MADHGLLVRNQSNIIQIDSTYNNHVLSASGYISTSVSAGSSWLGGISYAPAGTALYSVATVKVPAVNPILAFRVLQSNLAVNVAYQKLNNGIFEFLFVISDNNYGTPVVPFIQWFVFDVISAVAPQSTQYGLAVFNAAGERVFDSRYKYLKILGHFLSNADPVYSNLPSWAFDVPIGVIVGSMWRNEYLLDGTYGDTMSTWITEGTLINMPTLKSAVENINLLWAWSSSLLVPIPSNVKSRMYLFIDLSKIV